MKEAIRKGYHRAFAQSALLLLVVLLAACMWRISPLQPGAFSAGAALVIAVLVGIAEFFPLSLPTFGQVMPATLAVDIAGLILYGPYTTLAGYVLGIIAVTQLRANSFRRFLHQVAENGLSILLGGLVLWSTVTPGASMNWEQHLAITFLAVIVRVGADLGLAVLHVWAEHRRTGEDSWQTVLGGYAYLPLLVLAPVGIVAAYILSQSPWVVVFLAGPLCAQYISLTRHRDTHACEQKLRERNRSLEVELEVRTTDLNEAISQLQRRLSQMFSLQAVAAAITQELDLERLLSVIARQSARLTGGDGAFLTLLTDDGSQQFMRAAYGPLSEHVGVEICMKDRLTGKVMRSGRAEISNDALEDTRIDQQLVHQANISSLVEAPLKVKDRAVGVLGVTAHGGKRFDDEDVRLLTVLANQAAIAIENARLHERQTEMAVYEERNRLARELHDSVTQSLFSIGLYLQAAIQRVPSDPDQALSVLARVQEIAQEAQAEMRSLIFELRPAAIREKGIDFALENHISLIRRRHNLEIELIREGDRELPGDVEFSLYRVAQEALNNVTKHAQATRVVIEFTIDDRSVTLRVRDNGKGFDVQQTRAEPGLSFGLTSMRERVTSLGGRLDINSRPGEGTEVRAQIPLPLPA